MKNIALMIVALLCCVRLASPGPAKPSKLEQEIARLEAMYGGHLGLMAKNLKTGESVSFHGSERFPTASVIKLPILAAFFEMVDDKKIDPTMDITLRKEDMKPGSGVLQMLTEGDHITLLDAVKLMITQSDNTATNLVLDRLAPTHAQRLAVVNDFLVRKGFGNTRLINRLFSLDTKPRTPEAVRYGIGVTTPEEMVLLLEQIYARTLVSPASCDAMLTILKSQSDRATVPRLLPQDECKFIEIGNKTGSVNETKVDVALIQSDKADIAIAVFVDKHPDHRGDIENRGILLGALAARAVWNHFTGSSGYRERKVPRNDVDWNVFPGGRWGIYRSDAAPFPHRARVRGVKVQGVAYPYHPHYDDDSIVVVVPDSFKETAAGTNVIVHFHGRMDSNLGALEKFEMPQSLSAQKTNAILVLPQGPYNSPDSSAGKMEDAGGLKHLVDDVLSTMKNENILKSTRLSQVILSADGSGCRAVAFGLKRGGLENSISSVFLLDALQENQEMFRAWLRKGTGSLYAAYAPGREHEFRSYEPAIVGNPRGRLHLAASSLDHNSLVRIFFESWLKEPTLFSK